MSVKLQVSTEECSVILQCLRFVRQGIVLDNDTLNFKFVEGKPFSLSLRQGIELDFLKDYIETETETAINGHPLNPFVKFF